MNNYEIVKSATGEVVETMVSAIWPTVCNRIKQLNAKGFGVFARRTDNKASNVAASPLVGGFQETLAADAIHLFVDAWTSGNPGLGGYRGVDKAGVVLFSRDSVDQHTNNFFEVFAILGGIQYAEQQTCKVVIYSDSNTAIGWINSGRHAATRDAESITKVIEKARAILNSHPNIVIMKWDTNKYGEIPADYGRK